MSYIKQHLYAQAESHLQQEPHHYGMLIQLSDSSTKEISCECFRKFTILHTHFKGEMGAEACKHHVVF